MKPAPNLSSKRGNRLGIGSFRVLLKFGGLKAAFALAWFVTWFYARFDRSAFSAVEWYLKLRFPEDAENPRALRRHFHRLLCELARMLILSYRMGHGRALPIEEEGAENLPAVGGVVIVLAHYGCWQASMEHLNLQSGRAINIMARPDHGVAPDKYLALGGRRKFNVISTEGFSGGLVEASAALERGEAVIVMGDRAVEGAASAFADYLGGRIELPLSPWMLAARNEVPAVPVFTELVDSPLRVRIRYCRPVKFAAAPGRRITPEDLRDGLARYASELEEAARRSPYSVFRFGNER